MLLQVHCETLHQQGLPHTVHGVSKAFALELYGCDLQCIQCKPMSHIHR